MDKKIDDTLPVFKKIFKSTSKAFLYYAATCGFLFGWISMAIFLSTLYGEIPFLFVLLLRIFYFLISFLIGLKILIKIIEKVRRKSK